jgi:aryl-phospho-beta-D-glucosidase BglC (GH1 family)
MPFVFNTGISFSQSTDSTKAMIQNARIGRGVNLGNALEAPSLGAWGVELQEEYFKLIAEKGFNSVRVPIRWNAHASYNSPYTINEAFFDTVDWVIENSMKNGLYVIINFHHYEALYDDPDGEKQRFLKLWEQVCNRYAAYSDSLIFEILNEPHGNLTAPKWNSLLAEAYTFIRNLQPDRTLIVGVAEYGGIGGLSKLQLPAEDDNIILTVHYYNPFHFTHQGAGWVSGSDAWLGTKWGNTISERQTVQNEMQAVVEFSETHNIPVYMGEFGAYSKADYQSRVRWTNYIARYFDELGYSWAYWEFCSGFGIYNPGSKTWNEGLLYALLHMPMPNPSNGDTPEEAKNLITNPSFNDSTDHWFLYTRQNLEAEFSVVNQEAKVTIPASSSEDDDIALINSGLQVENQKSYRVTFNAYADAERQVKVSIMQGSNPWEWNPYSKIQSFTLTTEPKTFDFYFTMDSETDHNARFRLDAGESDVNLYVDDVAVEDLSIVSDTSTNKVTFTIKDKQTNEVLNNCQVHLLDVTLNTSDDGKVTFTDIPVGYHDVQVSKRHYQKSNKKKVTIYSDTSQIIYLIKKIYSDTIKIVEFKSKDPLSGVNVYLDSIKKTTDLQGEVVFQIPFGTYNISTEKTGYQDLLNASHMLSSDTLWVLELEKTHATLKFRISNDGQPVNEALVISAEDTITTNSLGIATFQTVPLNATYDYDVQKYGFESFNGTLSLNDDTTVNVELTKNLVDVKFNVLNEEEPLEDAMIIIKNDTIYTNSAGFAGFYDYPVNESYSYRILNKGYALHEGTIYVSRDTVIHVNMIASSFRPVNREYLNIYPNPATTNVTIHSTMQTITRIVVFDVQGRSVIKKEVHGNVISENIEQLNNGRYMVKVFFADDSEKVMRFIKND